MRRPQMTTRRWMIAVAVVAAILGGFIATRDLERRAVLYNQEAEYHRWKEDNSKTRAAYLESLVGDPSRSYDLLITLSKAGKRWQERALAARLELIEDESGTHWKRWCSEAKEAATRVARECRRQSEYHGRQKLRYERAALDPWHSVEPDLPAPK